MRVEGVSKKFCKDLKRSLWYGIRDIASDLLGLKKNQELRKDEFWAVNDVSFELRRGECLGLIGHNGAGKSTLLKMLNGLINPDKGKITMKGRIGALIELGAGFNPILTGRENVFNNGAVLGFSQKEIAAKYKAIVEFAELEEFMDTPVQNYSSGMKVRLGFAVAAQMEPDVLIIDEVLAVGDLGFRIKCLNRIHELLSRSSIIFVSHSMPFVARICNKGILIKNGSVSYSSYEIGDLIDFYNNEFKIGERNISGSGEVEVTDVIIKGISSNNLPLIPFGEDLLIHFNVNADKNIKKLFVRLVIWNADQRPVLDIITNECESFSWNNRKETVELSVKLSKIRLSAGKHFISIHVSDNNTKILCRMDNAVAFVIGQHLSTGADAFQVAEWKLLDKINP